MGSMVPDFEYFIRLRDFRRYSHTFWGMFWFDIPLGLAFLFLFHNVVRNTLIEHLPFSLNVRFSVFEKFNWNEYFKRNTIVVLISLLVGIASHLFLDSFTHNGGYFAEVIPLLNDKYYILDHRFTGATIFQYLGSVIGGLIMVIYIFNFPEGRNTRRDNILYFWLLVSLIAFMVVNIRLYLDYVLNEHNHEDIIVTSIAGFLLGIVVLSVFLKESSSRQLYKKLEKVRNK